MRLVGVYGGSFDPIHNGHLQMAQEVLELLQLDELRFLPCHIPPHKKGLVATAEQRLEMLNCALETYPQFGVDTREMDDPSPSYSYLTLAKMRAELGAEVSLAFIMGMDSWNTLPHWYRWKDLLSVANLVVVRRPGYSDGADQNIDASLLGDTLAQLGPGVGDVDQPSLRQYASGKVIFLATSEVAIASTEVRQKVQAGASLSGLLPASVEALIIDYGLYQGSDVTGSTR